MKRNHIFWGMFILGAIVQSYLAVYLYVPLIIEYAKMMYIDNESMLLILLIATCMLQYTLLTPHVMFILGWNYAKTRRK
ncbi:TMhelix containing protein [Vibrio phage 2.275.O._10N.286.54.E11]|nr:TMhelix containing protein [Vibrio phage 2.275.O._10N.286.54.E11]